jgi:uncharacterized protein YbaR (Trm112 family)
MSNSSCPVCKIPLSTNDENNTQSCSKCRREYYPIKEEQKSIIYEDIEPVSENQGEGNPILLCDNTDVRYYRPKEKENYLQKKFGTHCDIDTREEIPNG